MQYTDGVINLSSERCCGSYPIIFIPIFFPMVFSIPFGEGRIIDESLFLKNPLFSSFRWFVNQLGFRSVDEINSLLNPLIDYKKSW